ncbi:hypothetical protein V5T82_07180 [Magnetovibrio sp. PR-2]|uniref:DUF4870 family protein n=1 Tax=Magnetovibrio sp. PR-2 TaxID=3120356 RepID=UPI002FCE2CEE
MSTNAGQPEPEIIPPGQKSSSETKSSVNFDDVTDVLGHPLTMPRIAYALFAIASISGFPMLIGLIAAYLARGEAPDWLEGHYTFLIYTFWGGLLLIGIGLVTWIIGIGMLLLWLLPLWYVIRVVRGWILLENRRPVPNPQSLLFG